MLAMASLGEWFRDIRESFWSVHDGCTFASIRAYKKNARAAGLILASMLHRSFPLA
jgi:hypothetical protein